MMNYSIKNIKNLILLLLVFLVLFPTQNKSAVILDLVIIVNPHNPLTDISSVNLRRVWLGKIDVVDGAVLNPVSAEMQLNCKVLFYKEILNKSRKGFQKYSIREKLKGNFKKPKSFKNIKLLIENILTDTTAITFINVNDIPDSSTVKILTIDEKSFTDDGYKLKQ